MSGEQNLVDELAKYKQQSVLCSRTLQFVFVVETQYVGYGFIIFSG